jgi:glycosyltransferase involved in cell wall biosynthesis
MTTPLSNSSAAPQTLVLVDAGLSSFAGHHAMYAQGIGMGARVRGLDFRVIGPRSVDPALLEDLPLHPVFDAEEKMRLRHGPRFLLALANARCFWANLRELARALPNEPSVVLVDNTDYHGLLRWAVFLDVFPALAPITWVFMLRRICYDIDRQSWLQGKQHLVLAFRLFAARRHRRIHFVSDSERLITHYQKLTRASIHLVPIPHTHFPVQIAHTPQGRPLHFVFLGDARAEKGLLALIEAIVRVRAHPEGRDIRFTLQAHQASGRDMGVESALERLREALDPGLRLVDEPLPIEKYHALLNSADAVLCPYARARYQTTSGPFTEALAAGKPVLVTDGTWMSDQLQSHGAGLVCADQQTDLLAAAILQLQRDYPALARQSIERQKAWRCIHNPENFIDNLFRVAGGPT